MDEKAQGEYEHLLEWQDARIQKFREQGITFRLATPDDAQALVDIHNQEYGTHRTVEHWLWEYDTYAPDDARFRIAEKDGKIIATGGNIPIYMEVGGETKLASKGENAWCLPQYRGTGLAPAIGDWARSYGIPEHYQINFNLRNIDKLHGRNNITPVYRNIQVWTRPGNPKIILTKRLLGDMTLWRGSSSLKRAISTGKLAAQALTRGKISDIPQVSILPGYELRKGRTPLEDLQSLRERLLSINEHVIWIKYDDKYLDWRIRQHPFNEYNEYQVYKGDVLKAYAFTTEHQGEVCLSDLLSEDPHATSVLLSTFLSDYTDRAGQYRFMGNPVDQLSIDLFRQLPQFGFSLAMKWNLTVRDRKAALGTEFFQIRNWHVNGLWTEGFLY
jgi:hypothetical protein